VQSIAEIGSRCGGNRVLRSGSDNGIRVGGEARAGGEA
jgi:hypothetical protein